MRSLGQLKGYSLLAKDGEFGRTSDFLLDERYWAVRYLVADTGVWLFGKTVLLSPLFLGEPKATLSQMPVKLTRETIENSPELDEHAPVSRRAAAFAGDAASTHLRSAAEIQGYSVYGDDREIGEVADFVLDTGSWRIQSLVVDTPLSDGATRSVLVSPKWVACVSWADRAIEIGLPGDALRARPAYRPRTESAVSVAPAPSSLQPA